MIKYIYIYTNSKLTKQCFLVHNHHHHFKNFNPNINAYTKTTSFTTTGKVTFVRSSREQEKETIPTCKISSEIIPYHNHTMQNANVSNSITPTRPPIPPPRRHHRNTQRREANDGNPFRTPKIKNQLSNPRKSQVSSHSSPRTFN